MIPYQHLLTNFFHTRVPLYFLLLGTGIWLPVFDASSQHYFQQEVNYTINVTLDDRKHELTGSESVEYINNSPDTLTFLYFHLWPNAYSDNNTPLARQIIMLNGKEKLFNDSRLRGFIDSLDFQAEDVKVSWDKLQGFPDICKITLNKPLKPEDTIYISTPFHIKIPEAETSLLGHEGQSYNISQWYPKPAVYDRTGWHQMPYLDQGEFYSEFGSYDVSITLPSNYIVAATGNLQNEEELRHLGILSEDKTWMKSSINRDTGHPVSSNIMKTLRYIENDIHDFAWFADKRFRVQKGTVTLPESGREVITWAMFTDNQAPLWTDAIHYANNALLSFSEWIGDYPYRNFSVVQSVLSSGAGMEYPGLAVISHTEDPYLLEGVIAHETCHNWFYSALGSDERRFPFMDESIVGAYESRYMIERHPDKRLWEIYFRNSRLADLFNLDKIPVQREDETTWLIRARNNLEQPADRAAPEYSRVDYNTIIYNKGAQGFTWLRSYLGDSLFDSIIHDYYNTWKYRHPSPDDLWEMFKTHTSKDLSWFFDDFLSTTKRLDYKLARIENSELLIKNKGELNAPLLIAEMSGDSVIAEKWVEGFEGKKWIKISNDDQYEIKIDPRHVMPELFRLNNSIRTSAVCRRSDPFQFRFLYNYDEPDKRSLVYIPAVDWNSTDGFMAGLAIHNGMLMRKPVQYFAIPLYIFKNPGLAGYGKISFNFIPYNRSIRLATLSLEGTQYGAPGNQYYKKLKIGLDLNISSGNSINPVYRKIFGNFVTASDLYQVELLTRAKMRSFLTVGYGLERRSNVNPFNMIFSIESGKGFQKTAIDINYKYSYNGRNNGLDIRVFAGAMLKNTSENSLYAISPDGRSGRDQYLFNGIYPDRFGVFPLTFWSRQMSLSEGGLVTPVNDSLGYSRSICSVTLTSTLPWKASRIPVKPFFTILLNNPVNVPRDKSPLFFEAGFKAGFWNFFEIYFPLLVSGNIEELNGSLENRIRFVFKLDIFNPSGF